MDISSFKFRNSHEWVSIEGEIATVGISAFAVEQLTDLVFIDLPSTGDPLEAGGQFGEVESVKAVSDLYSPVAGEVVEVNEDLADDLAVLSEDPYGKGWMIKIKISDAATLDNLLDADAYQAHCDSESH
ncbi:Glycine cleavage system H protein [hydrothermal vent metagenome]|uniref:Glycine cleavage system H protein n=1 Tax=hydrothermal vent metagenome TaxID=652676 RepID=A0A3B1DNB9_9ZZZZ